MTLPDEVDVLVVDDDPLEAEVTIRPLKEARPDARIGVARDGEEALDFLLARGAFRHRLGLPLPRLILLDFKLPRLDGLDVLRAIRSSPRTSTAPVVMMTSSAEPREIAQCYHLGANSIVQKPVVIGEFRAMLRDLGRYWLGINQVTPGPSPLP
ncbi:MAG: response regulator [Gemmatimonadales bacterium]